MMAKGEKKVQVVRIVKPKTAAQREKAELNKAKAQFRLQLLQDKQKLAAELRQKFGYFGTDDQVLAKHRQVWLEKQRAEEEAAKAEERRLKTEAEVKKAQKFITIVLEQTGKTGELIKRWLAGRETRREPQEVVRLIVGFLNRPGCEKFKSVVDLKLAHLSAQNQAEAA